MGELHSVNIGIFGEKLAITTITSMCIASKESPVGAAERSSSALSSLNAVRIFVQAAKNLHRCEERRSAVQSASGKVREAHIDRGWNSKRLTTLERQCKRDIAPVVAHWMLIKLLAPVLKMNDCCSFCATDPCNIFGQSCINDNSRVRARSVI